MATLHNINIKLYSYSSLFLDKEVKAFIEFVKNVGGTVCGPIPLPNETKGVTIVRSPFVHKKSMEHFVRITHKRLVRILNVTPDLIDELSKFNIQSKVGVEISITN